ncbi:MAG: D-alanyl-D-alanine carboxypeptidase family protein [Patescibacteria group bacterium]|nr:D-alanyl-D-alanine carboxypeptidase family protein [Patescibacteria group bacterium]
MITMNSHWKIITFFIICIAAGLGIGVGISKVVMNKKEVVQPVSQTKVKKTSETTPLVSDDVPSLAATGTDNASQSETVAVATDKAAAVPKPAYKCAVAPEGQADQWLAPVGPDYDLGKTYIPNHLVVLENYVVTSSSTMCLNASAALKLQVMESAMKAAGLHVVVSSAYRTANYQEGLLEKSEAKRDKIKNPYPLVALAGHSEHQLGMAVDLTAAPDYSLDNFINTPEYAWLELHSYEYGFIESYPSGSEAITGYSTESWHYRYVGVPNALAIHNQGITTYQYLKNLAIQESMQQKAAPIAGQQ